MPTWETENIFAGTAAYYARYRPEYPEQVIRLLVDKYSLDKKSRVLDLGCGPGSVAVKIAPFVDDVVAIDPLDEMLKQGKTIAAANNVSNIKWLLGESGKLTSLAGDIGKIDLVVIAQAFHWMDEEQTLRDLYPMVKGGGGLALIAADGPKTDSPDTPWKVIIQDTTRCWLGEIRRAGTKGIYTHRAKRFEEVLEDSEFHGLETASITVERIWTFDNIIGYLYSTSSCSIPILGDKKEGFEKDLRERLAASEPSGLFKENAVTEVMMVWK